MAPAGPLPLFPSSAPHFYAVFLSYIRGITWCGTFWNLLLFFFFAPCWRYSAVCSTLSHGQIIGLFPIWGFYKSNQYQHSRKKFRVHHLSTIKFRRTRGRLYSGWTLVFLRNDFMFYHFMSDSLSLNLYPHLLRPLLW